MLSYGLWVGLVRVRGQDHPTMPSAAAESPAERWGKGGGVTRTHDLSTRASDRSVVAADSASLGRQAHLVLAESWQRSPGTAAAPRVRRPRPPGSASSGLTVEVGLGSVVDCRHLTGARPRRGEERVAIAETLQAVRPEDVPGVCIEGK